MKAEYKKLIINGLYGLMEGSPKALEVHLIRRFKELYNFEADEITVIESKHRLTIPGEYGSSWIGAMKASITVNGETFSYERDWGQEYDIDVKHPDYHSDDWFYESDKCQSYFNGKEAIESIDNEIMKVKDWKDKQ
jgi:hypothetical protein